MSSGGLDLIRQLMVLQPDRRISARAALRHPWLEPSTEVVRLTRVIDIDTALMRRFNSRRHWAVLRSLLSWIKLYKPIKEGAQLDFDSLVIKHIKKNRLKKCFKRKKNVK